MRERIGGLRVRGAESKHTYKMHEKLVSIGDDFWIENEEGKREFYVDGKALRLRETPVIKDVQGNELYKLKEKLLRVKDTMGIQDANGETVATIKKALIAPLRGRWKLAQMAKGNAAFAVGLMALLMVVTILYVPIVCLF